MKTKLLSYVLVLLFLLPACDETPTHNSESTSAVSTEMVEQPFIALGTGAKKPEGYTLPLYSYRTDDILKYDMVDYKLYNWRIEGMADKQLQDEINSFIKESEITARNQTDEVIVFAESKFEYPTYWLEAEANCINGYLSVMVSHCYQESAWAAKPRQYYKPLCAVWDLYTGKRLQLTDLFWEGVYFIDTINSTVRDQTDWVGPWRTTYELTGEFWGLPADFTAFTLDKVYFASGENVFLHGLVFYYDSACRYFLVTKQPRDMQGIWESSAKTYKQLRVRGGGVGVDYGNGALWLLDAKSLDADPAICDKINTSIRKKVDKTLSTAVLDKRFGKDQYFIDGFGGDISCSILGDYVFYNGSAYIVLEDKIKNSPYIRLSAAYDLRTGNEIALKDVFTAGWQSAILWENGKKGDVSKAPDYILQEDEFIVGRYYDANGVESHSFRIPVTYFNMT